MIGTISPAYKYLLQQSNMPPLEMATSRAFLAFVLLLPITLFWAKDELMFLGWRDIGRLSLVGLLGVGFHYGMAI